MKSRKPLLLAAAVALASLAGCASDPYYDSGYYRTYSTYEYPTYYYGPTNGPTYYVPPRSYYIYRETDPNWRYRRVG